MKYIYVVDDSIDFLDVFSSLLRKNKFHPVAIDTRQLLFERLQLTTPDLCLIDVKFSYNDGRKLCHDLKLKYGLREVPVILISGYHEKLTNYKDYLADDILEKPFSFEQFLE